MPPEKNAPFHDFSRAIGDVCSDVAFNFSDLAIAVVCNKFFNYQILIVSL